MSNNSFSLRVVGLGAYRENAPKECPRGQISLLLHPREKRKKMEKIACSMVSIWCVARPFSNNESSPEEIIIFMKKLCHLQSVYLVLIFLFEFHYD